METFQLGSEEKISFDGGGDAGTNRFSLEPGRCIVTNQRIVWCPILLPEAKAVGKLFGPIGKVIVHVLALVGLVAGKKPNSMSFAVELKELASLSVWRLGPAHGIKIVSRKGDEMLVKLGTKKQTMKWLANCRAVYQQNLPDILLNEVDGDLLFGPISSND